MRFWSRFREDREENNYHRGRRGPQSSQRIIFEAWNSFGGAGDAGEGFGVVEVEDAAFFVGGELGDFGAVRPDDGACAHVERRGLQFREKFRGKNDRMAAASFEYRQNDRRVRRVKRGDEIADEIRADEWMVYEAEKHAV